MLKTNFDSLITKLNIAPADMAEELAQESVRLFQENFRKQGFFEENTWKPRKNNTDPKRGILIGKGGGAKLWRSLRYTISANKITIVADRPYAAIHNEGGKAIQYVKPFTVNQHKRKVGKKKKKVDVKRYQVKAFTRKINMPKRQFIGEHVELTNKLNLFIENYLNNNIL